MKAFVIFIPIDKWGNDDLSRNRIIYDTDYLLSVDLVKLPKRNMVYKVYRKGTAVSYLNARFYRFTFGVVNSYVS